MGLIIMLCLTIGIMFGLIGLTIWMTTNRNVRYTILAKLIWRITQGRTLVELEKLGMSGSRGHPERFGTSCKLLMMPLTTPRLQQVEKLVMSGSRGLQEVNPFARLRPTTRLSAGSTGDQHISLSLSVHHFFRYCTLTICICNFLFNNKNKKTR